MEKMEKDRTISDLKIHNRNLKIQVRQLQDTFLKQEIGLTRAAEDQRGRNGQEHQQAVDIQQLGHSKTSHSPSRSAHRLSCFSPAGDTPQIFACQIMDQSSLGSPEIERKYEASLEQESALHLTHLSDISAIHSSGLEMGHSRSFALQKDTPPPVESLSLYSDSEQYRKDRHDLLSPLPSESAYSATGSTDTEKAEDFRNLHVTLSGSHENGTSALPVPEWVSDGYGSNASSDVGAKLNLELEKTERLDASFLEYLRQRGIALYDDIESMGQHTRATEVLAPELQVLLKKVHEEGCRILALSERRLSSPVPHIVTQPNMDLENWQQERHALLDVIQSLKELIATTLKQEDKSASDASLDWRRELLHAVHSVFEKEQNSLCTELLSQLRSRGTGDDDNLVERLKQIIEKQEEEQRLALEDLLTADRSSLLAEVQDLQAQLRITHLQNQEKLQQLQETLTSVEDHGRKRENQLRKQVELQEYKLQQEQLIASDLQKSLDNEQQRSTELREHLKMERAAVDDLRLELSKSSEELERLLKTQQELQKEITRLSSMLENKENDLLKAIQSLEKERQNREELQSLLEQEQLHRRQRENREEDQLEELKASLEDRHSQCKQLLTALEHEQASNSNLRKELQIEQSRCEALLSQERNKLLEVQNLLEIEKGHSLELGNALNRERALTEQLSQKRSEESARNDHAASQEQSLIQELQSQLEEARSRAIELAAMVEKTQQQAILSKRQLEAETQLYREEAQKEREVSGKLRATLESLQNHKEEISHSIELERQQGSRLQLERDQLQARLLTMKEQERSREEQREREKRQERRALTEKEREREQDRTRMHELELQHQRDEQRIRELQQSLAELEEQERALTSQKRHRTESPSPEKRHYSISSASPSNSKALQLRQQQLENARQQLVLVASRLMELMQKTTGRFQVSDDDLFSMMQSLMELNSELQQLSLGPQARYLHPAETVQEAERGAWQRERTLLQNALKQAEAKLSRVTAEIENRPQTEGSNPKMLRLYRRYLRAESFRKALVYQKKYLLLLLGGFQDCETATLSLIARMGVYPSPTDLQRSAHRPRAFTRFRCAVRVVIAVSRIKFLVKKWQKVTRKGVPLEGIANGVVHVPASGSRTEVLRQQQPPAMILNSPPTRDIGARQQTGNGTLTQQTPKSPFRLHNRSPPSPSRKSSHERSYSSSRDPERSLTEYIHHLEAIQQRLGGLQEESSFGNPSHWNKTK